MVKSRIFAYIVDILIITVILNIFALIIPKTDNYMKLNQELEALNEKYIDNEISTKVYINNQADILKDLDKENVLINIFQGFLIIGYFIILPYYNDGKTFGKKMFNIKIVSEDGELDYNKLIVRAVLINGLGYLLISLSCVYILPSFAYYVLTTVLGLIEFIILIASLITIIKNKEKGLHDKISKTKVIND